MDNKTYHLYIDEEKLEIDTYYHSLQAMKKCPCVINIPMESIYAGIDSSFNNSKIITFNSYFHFIS